MLLFVSLFFCGLFSPHSKAKANNKGHNLRKIGNQCISDVAIASVHSEKTRLKKIIGEREKRARHSQVCSIENRGYIIYILWYVQILFL